MRGFLQACLRCTLMFFGFGLVLSCVLFWPTELPVEAAIPKKKTEDQIIYEASRKHKVPAIVVYAVRRQESTDGTRLYRYEPGQLKKTVTLTKDPYERKMLASSHCQMHVLGLTARRRKVHWSKLYDLETCYDTGVQELAICKQDAIERAQKKKRTLSEVQAWKRALVCYNGAEEYVPLVLAHLGEITMENMYGM